MRLTALRRFQLNWLPPRAAGAWKVPSDPDSFDLFLLMGQSNMAGFGCVRVDDPWKLGDFDPVPHVLVLGGQSKLRSVTPQGRSVWRPGAHPLHLNQQSCGFGLGLPFAAALLKSTPERSVGLIPCAWGGAAIDEIHFDTPLFANAVKRATWAKRQGRLRAVLWHQGESDTTTADLAGAHAARLDQFMGKLRAALDCPSLPFLIGDLAEFTEAQKRERNAEAADRNAKVRAGLRAVAENDPHSAFVESAGLTGVDDVHFGRESLVAFGQRYAETWSKLVGDGVV